MIMTNRYGQRLFALALVFASVGGAGAQGLPGGATSLDETHGDWTVTCRTRDGVARCAISQTQVSGENRQRVLAVELTAAEGGEAAGGVLVLPFGLRLDAGVRLAIDDAEPLDPLRFSTCLAGGCLVPPAFDAGTVTTMEAGTAASVTATASDSGQEFAFSISLHGFGPAFDRLTALSAP
jgi:invasion protein IalB